LGRAVVREKVIIYYVKPLYYLLQLYHFYFSNQKMKMMKTKMMNMKRKSRKRLV
jgi:hypothetical protein